jgi:putative peptidoglycan lipid II flippase
VIEPLGYVVFPFFAALAVKEDRTELTDVLMTALRGLVLLLLPMSVGLFLLRRAAVLALFAHGRFANVDLTVAPLTWYSLGVVAFGLDIILMRAYFSLRDIGTPVVLEILTFFTNLVLILLLRGSMEGAGIALAFTLARTGKVVVLFALLKTRIGTVRLRENLIFLIKVMVAVGIMGLWVYACREFLSARLDPASKINRLVVLGASAAAGGVTYAVSVILLRITEIKKLISMAKRIKKPS